MVRKLVQIGAAFLQNAHLYGFVSGRLYRGPLKKFCVPGLNCYSCPAAIGACPLGSLQALATNIRFGFSLYVYGFLVFIGVIAGRFVCGFLCPFGLIQELLHKIPLKKIREKKFFILLSKLKYLILIIFVIAIPTLITVSGGIGYPAFCQWICPAGTLEAGIPLVLHDQRLHRAIGFNFWWKISILIIVIYFSIKILRPFCRFICPLGAIYSLFNRISIVHIRTDKEKCQSCQSCADVCPVNAKSTESFDCIRCGDCMKKCPSKVKRWSLRSVKN
ncbi:MAG: 4Fe-4S binding protein [Lachnospiraceae bacterium]|nr:4Fe-4S binding protein [Lachnospiraceae bacterium]